MENACNIIELKNIDLGFGKGSKRRILFRGINASVRSGQVVALIGANGRGKSTLLRTICSLIPIFNKEGRILFNGESLDSYNGGRLSSMVAYVPSQVERVNALSVRDMVGLNRYYKTNWCGKLRPEDEAAILHSLKLVGLDSFIDADCSTLSDGEFQRVAIAAALAQESSALVLDEPTAFLDIANKFNISQLLSYIAHTEGKSVIFSTHDLQYALKYCDKIWLMTECGEPSFVEGTAFEIIAGGHINRLFSTPDIHFNTDNLTFERIS